MKKQFFRNRKTRYAGIAVVLTVLVIAVTVLINEVFGTFVERYSLYTLMRAEGDYDVTEDCYALLGDVFSDASDSEVEIIFCDVPENLRQSQTVSYIYATASSIAERFPDRVKIQCYDIYTHPNTVKSYASVTDPATGENKTMPLKSTSVIIRSGTYYRPYDVTEFFIFKGGNQEDVWAYNGERKLTAGIMRALDPVKHTVCLTNTHGETFYDYELAYLLDDAGYTIAYVDLLTDPIPADCEMIISYNPNSDLVADEVSAVSEIDVLDRFLETPGHSFLVMVENGTPRLANYEAFLQKWGVEMRYYHDANTGSSFRYMVEDSSQSLTSDGYTIYGEPVRTGRSGQVLSELNRPVVFKNATAARASQGFLNAGDGSFRKGDRTLYQLYTGGENALCWANGTAVDGGHGASLVTLTEQKSAGGSSYVGVFTSSDFFRENTLQSAVYGNTDAALRVFRTINGRRNAEGLTIKPFSSTDISLITTSQMVKWTVALTALPVAVILCVALTVLVRRRRS